ncbi:hypothetical protein [Acinetobacter sp. SA01]|uniref:hypothetical protein n=1 Tax=Acinetobacter sp. SA01 TaxID=1862567 RepID=UPI001F0F619B|nr:hypothetical protein [Acinetobacter sp. SA01]
MAHIHSGALHLCHSSSISYHGDIEEEEYSEKYGHELYAIDDVEGKKIFIDINDPWSVSSNWGSLENEIKLIKIGLFPLILRQKFESKETFEKKSR